MRQDTKRSRPARTVGLVLFCLPAISASVDDSRFEPFIEKHDTGWIDWENGMIYGVGRGYRLQPDRRGRGNYPHPAGRYR